MTTKTRASTAARASKAAPTSFARLLALLVAATLLMQLTPASPASAAEATLTQDVTPEDPPHNGNLAVSSVVPFDSAGGTAALRPGTEYEEEFTYTGVDSETLILTGVRRETPIAHPNGSSVAPVDPSPTASPPPGGEAESPTPSTASDGGDAASSPASEEVSADTASTGANGSGADASAVGASPPPCEELGTCEIDPGVGCQGCDELVDQLVGLIEACQLNDCIAPVNELITKICGGRDALSCQRKLSEVLAAAVGEVCPYGLATCADPTINVISRLVMDTVCPSGSIGYCVGQVSAEVNEQVAFVVGVARGLIVLGCTGDTANHCVQAVQALLDAWVFQTVCGSANAFTCVGNLQDAINDAAANTCELNRTVTVETSDSAVTNCVALVLDTAQFVIQTLGDAMSLACGSSDPNVCAANVITKIHTEVNRVCASIPGDRNTTGVNECLDKAMQIVNTGVETAEQVMRDTCGSDNPAVCANNVVNQLLLLIDKVNDLVANTCAGQTAGTTSTSDSASTECVERALIAAADVQRLVSQKMVETCGSSDPNACAANVVTKINDEITRICTSVPGTSYSTGATRCTERVLQLVGSAVLSANEVMRQQCGSDNPAVCANNVVNQLLLLIDQVNDLVTNACKGETTGAPASTSDSAITECVDRTLATVAAVQQLVTGTIVDACGSDDPNACTANVLAKINVEVNRICASLPGDRTTTGVNECTDKTWQIINTAVEAAEQRIRETCGSVDPTSCAGNIVNELLLLIDWIDDAVADACNQQVEAPRSTTDPALTDCVNGAIATLDTVENLVAQKVGEICGSSGPTACGSPVLGLCDPGRVGQTCQEYLNGLCQTRATLPQCAQQIVALTEASYAALRDDIFPDAASLIDAQFCTDPDNCDVVMSAVAEVLYREVREDCALEDVACLQMYASDINDSIAAVALITCSSAGCADYVTTRIQVGIAENVRIFRTLVFEILEGLPTDPGQLEIALARDAEIPDPLVEPLVDLLVPGPGSGSVDETPGGAGEGAGGEVAGGAVTGGGGRRRCVFKGTSYNKGSMDYEGSTNPDDPATTGSGGFSYTDDDLGAHSSNEAYVRSPFSTGQTEHHKDAQITGVKFKYVKGKYGGDWVAAELSYPWHVEGELSVNNTWTNLPIGGIFSSEGIADYSVWVGYVDLTEGDDWNFAQVSDDRLEKDGHRYISDDPVAPPSLSLQLKPGHTYAAWIEIFTSATAHAMFSTRSEVKSYFATHFPSGHPPNNERHDRSWLDKVVLETERRVRCGAGSA